MTQTDCLFLLNERGSEWVQFYRTSWKRNITDVAMPHSQENAEGVHKTGIGFMVNKQIVDFGEDDGEQKVAKLFFTLAACNPDEHMNNIEQLTQIFMNEPLLDALMEAETPEDILKAEADHPFQDDFY